MSEHTAIQEEKMFLDRSLDLAVDAGVMEFIRLEDETLHNRKDIAVQFFFHSLHAALGITDYEDAKRKLDFYVPTITVIDDTGFYINYMYVENKHGYKSCERRWTQRIPFSYEDKNLIYLFSLKDLITVYDKGDYTNQNFGVNVIQCREQDLLNSSVYEGLRKVYPDSFVWSEEEMHRLKKEVITKALEEYMNYYINEHNHVAKEFGITYQFLLPSMEGSDFLRSIEAETVIAVFQGYPLQSADLQYYNRVSVAGASLHKDEHYYIEKKDWYYIYHQSDCKRLITFLPEISFSTKKECASYGAFACLECNHNVGSRPPE